MRFLANDTRRNSPTLVNPLSELAPQMRSTLLPGMLSIAMRNVGRGENDLALFELGSVFLGEAARGGFDPGVETRPTELIWQQMQSALPAQPEHLGVVMSGALESAGVWGSPRIATWRDSIDAVLVVANELGVNVEVRTGSDPSFHPGRCAEIVLTDTLKVVGFAGELHPAVVQHWNLPKRSCAAEVDLSALLSAAVTSATAPVFSNSPVAKEDLAFVVDRECPVAEVQSCIRAAGGELLESVRLFDVYEGDQIPPSHKSLAFALRFRGEGQTLSPQELQNLRTHIITAVADQVGGTLR